ncbi:hypothetical protein GQ44DRAFT_722568 [Phaeosphaeriaceae sp. PMI808]|nr:hypothetical protein GQ44DRAFT_722568 [Phaeosphaeriaceae sp. PMI808]
MPTTPVPSSQRRFRRGYMACVLCRAHKVRCVLGTGPPCSKCRREHRECVFERANRGPRTREAPQWAEPVQLADPTATENGEQHDHTNTAVASESSRDDPPVTEVVEPINARRSSSNNTPRLQVPAQPPSSLLDRTMCPNETLAFFNELHRSEGDGSAGSATVSTPPTQSNPHPPSVHELSQVDDEALHAWKEIPFVRLGWFTAREAFTYWDMEVSLTALLFHRHIAPFCPAFVSEVEVGTFQHTRIAQEPMLCTTILMIASRLFTLPGPRGLARSYLIHHRLWQQCENLIQLLMYGQERHMRGNHTPGTIQSLLLLSEWHPRSLRSQFCSSQSGMWEDRQPTGPFEGSSESSEQLCLARYQQYLLDRAKQSDRVSWMMVGAALNLAHEAGVFVDAYCPNGAEDSERLGVLRTRKLIYLYVTSLSIRLGFQNTFAQDIIILTRAILPSEELGRSGPDSWDLSIELWLGLVRLSRTASSMFFRTTSDTKNHLRSGDYILLLQSFAVTLSKWYDDFVALQSGIGQDIQRLLLIEYHNLKTYTHALAIQAILERARSQNFTCLRKDRLELLGTCYLPEDSTFIHEVITSSHIILQTTIEMAADGRLRFIPIHQFQCIMSAFVFLFKAINLCTSRESVQTSLVILEQCIRALEEADIDEMDVSRDIRAFLHSQVRRIQDDANVFFSAFTDPDQTLDAQVMADLVDSPADTMRASQPLRLGVDWNRDSFAMLGFPADLAAHWSFLDASDRLPIADPPWQSNGSLWDASR